jgi:hypothetical protein
MRARSLRLVALAGAAVVAITWAIAPAGAQPAQPGSVHSFAQVSWRPVDPGPGARERMLPPADRLAQLEREQQAAHDLGFRTDLRFTADGRVEQTITTKTLVLRSEGARAAGNSVFSFDPYTTQTTVEHAHTLLPDGTVVPVSREHAVLQNPQSDDVLGGDVQLVLPHAAIAPSAVLLARVKMVHEPRRQPMPWAGMFYPETVRAAEGFDVVVAWDSDATRPAWRGDHPSLVETQEGPRQVRLSVGRMEGIELEDSGGSARDQLPQLVVAQPTSWKSLSRSLAGLYRDKQTGDARVSAALATIVRPEDDALARFEKIQRFVAGSIRYVALVAGTGGVVPRPSHVTLERRFGDCKDKTVLFLDMARLAGITAHPVLVATSRRRIDRLLVPSAGYFDHLVACAALERGGRMCTDLTDPYAAAGELPSSVHGAVALELLDEGSDAPSLMPEEAVQDVSVHSLRRVQPDGSIHEIGRREHRGHAASELRGAMKQMGAEEQRTFLRELYQEAFGSKAEPTMSVVGLDDIGGPLTIHWDLSRPNAVRLDPKGELLDADGLATAIGAVAPVYAHHARGAHLRSEVRYVLPPGWRVTYAGPGLDYRSEAYRFVRTHVMGGAEVTFRSEIQILARRVEPAAVEAHDRVMRVFQDETRQMVGFAAR